MKRILLCTALMFLLASADACDRENVPPPTAPVSSSEPASPTAAAAEGSSMGLTPKSLIWLKTMFCAISVRNMNSV